MPLDAPLWLLVQWVLKQHVQVRWLPQRWVLVSAQVVLAQVWTRARKQMKLPVLRPALMRHAIPRRSQLLPKPKQLRWQRLQVSW